MKWVRVRCACKSFVLKAPSAKPLLYLKAPGDTMKVARQVSLAEVPADTGSRPRINVLDRDRAKQYLRPPLARPSGASLTPRGGAHKKKADLPNHLTYTYIGCRAYRTRISASFIFGFAHPPLRLFYLLNRALRTRFILSPTRSTGLCNILVGFTSSSSLKPERRPHKRAVR